MKAKFLLSILFAALYVSLSAQSSSDFTYRRGETIEESVLPATPQAASVSGYFSSAFSYSTGSAQIDIPFYTLAGHELSIPIGLRYSGGSGIKLNEVGLVTDEMKERQKIAEKDIDSIDFGARLYSPVIRRWATPDPKSEDWYGISPYAYCAGDPVNFVDPDGKFITVAQDENDPYKYIVTGGEIDDDQNVYIGSKEDNNVLGTMLTPYSFAGDDGNIITGAIINVQDASGQDFLNDFMSDPPGIYTYVTNAGNWKTYDFKSSGISDSKLSGTELTKYHYRGYSVNIFGDGFISSARDIGNFAAGYILGRSNIPWEAARFALDVYDSYKRSKCSGRLRISIEGKPTQSAQIKGYYYGNPGIAAYKNIKNGWR